MRALTGWNSTHAKKKETMEASTGTNRNTDSIIFSSPHWLKLTIITIIAPAIVPKLNQRKLILPKWPISMLGIAASKAGQNKPVGIGLGIYDVMTITNMPVTRPMTNFFIMSVFEG